MRVFHLGQRMALTIITATSQQSYSVLVQELEDNHFYVDFPGPSQIQHDKSPRRVQYHIQFFDTSGIPCSFETTDVSITIKDRLRLLRIKKPVKDSITRSQRRDFARISSSFPLGIVSEDSLIPCRVLDISGGGISFHLHHSHSFHVGDKLLFRFSLTIGQQVDSFEQDSIIRRIEPSPDLLEHNLYGIEFLNMLEQDQIQIIRYVMNKQIERRERHLQAQIKNVRMSRI